MKKKYLIVIADYYKDISKGLLSSAKSTLPKSSLIKLSMFQVFLKYQLQFQKILKNMMLF